MGDIFYVQEGAAPLTPKLALAYIDLMVIQAVIHHVMLCLLF